MWCIYVREQMHAGGKMDYLHKTLTESFQLITFMIEINKKVTALIVYIQKVLKNSLSNNNFFIITSFNSMHNRERIGIFFINIHLKHEINLSLSYSFSEQK